MLSEKNQYLRRILRLFIIPKIYIYNVPWDECKKNKFLVFYDFIYIYFILKYSPYNYGPCRLWEKNRKEWFSYYGSIYEPYQRKKIRKKIQPEKYKYIFDNKIITYQKLHNLDIEFPKCFCTVDKENIKEKIYYIFDNENVSKLIFKPVSGKGGKNIFVVSKSEQGSIFISQKNDEKIDIDKFELKEKSILQEFIKQDKEMGKIYQHSVNTVRLVTFLSHTGKVIIVGAIVRFGISGNIVDNISQGGIAVGVDTSSGRLYSIGYDLIGRNYYNHPNTKVIFEGISIPFWAEVLSIANKVQEYFHFYSLIGIDIAISHSGPVVVELNSSPDLVGIERCCGPILKNKELFDTFKYFDLFINKKQAHLYE